MIACLLKPQIKTIRLPLSKVVWQKHSSSQILSDYRVFQDQADFLDSNKNYRSVITGSVAVGEYQNAIQAQELALARARSHYTVLVYALGVDPKRVTYQSIKINWGSQSRLNDHDGETWAEFVRIR